MRRALVALIISLAMLLVLSGVLRDAREEGQCGRSTPPACAEAGKCVFDHRACVYVEVGR